MFDVKDVAEFFDGLAEEWDLYADGDDDGVIEVILDRASVSAGDRVLDVGCGTGRLFPYYLRRKVSSLTGIDVSPKMIEIAKRKFPEGITLICADAQEYGFEERFDRIVVYNAFPHFPDPEKMICSLAEHLNKGGTLTIAHGQSREEINRRHSMMHSDVSHVLMSAEELSRIFSAYLNVTVSISNDRMYQVTGEKK